MENVNYIPNSKQNFEGDLALEGLTSFRVTEDLVFKKLSDLKTCKTPGPDELHPKILHELRSEISKPLMELYNNVIRNWSCATRLERSNSITAV